MFFCAERPFFPVPRRSEFLGFLAYAFPAPGFLPLPKERFGPFPSPGPNDKKERMKAERMTVVRYSFL
jgi:hypothetical protein